MKSIIFKYHLLTISSVLLFPVAASSQSTPCSNSDYLAQAAELAECRAELALSTLSCPACNCDTNSGSEEEENLCADTLQDYESLSDSYILQKSKLQKARKRIKILKKKLRRLK